MRAASFFAAALAVVGCSSGDFVSVDVLNIPANSSRLIARFTLDDWPAESAEEFGAGAGFGGGSTFAIKLPSNTSGRLAVAVEAWDGQCAVATGTNFVDLAGGESRLEVQLSALPARICSTTYQRTPGIVQIPAGVFTMGCQSVSDPSCETDETVVRNVTLSAYEIDVTEVSTAAYAACMQHGHCTAPFISLPPTLAAQALITWDQAGAYCAAHGKRLLTEAEWERAARGDDRRIYPWGGDPPTCQRANFQTATSMFCRSDSDRVAPVGALGLPSASPFQVLDMAGNLEEWVADWYASPYPTGAATDPTGPTSGMQRVLRGGSWISTANEVRASRRNGNAPDASAAAGVDLSPTANSTTFGIRCGRTL
jgi:formylglycine-generating enzyme required for sulfatase activity